MNSNIVEDFNHFLLDYYKDKPDILQYGGQEKTEIKNVSPIPNIKSQTQQVKDGIKSVSPIPNIKSQTQQVKDKVQQKTGIKTLNADAFHKATFEDASIGLAFNIMKMVYEYVILYSLKMSNIFLSQLEVRLKDFVEDAGEKEKLMNSNKVLTITIFDVIRSKEFQEKWDEFTTVISDLVGKLVSKIAKETDVELEGMAKDITDLFYKNTKNAVKGIGRGVMEGICAVPPLMPMCELANVVGTGSKLTSETFLTFMRTAATMAKSFGAVFGESSEELAKSINESIEMYETVLNLMDPEKGIGLSMVNAANNTVNRLTPSLMTENAGISLPSTRQISNPIQSQTPAVTQGINPTISKKGGRKNNIKTRIKRKKKQILKTRKKYN
tara:strand:+ start:19758 stop:20906 length:1149 start_codon:yes stop_codon:yes gene_type:complete